MLIDTNNHVLLKQSKQLIKLSAVRFLTAALKINSAKDGFAYIN